MALGTRGRGWESDIVKVRKWERRHEVIAGGCGQDT